MSYEVKVNSIGDKEWLLNGVLHREDGPAVEWVNGRKEWWIAGTLHREGGPALEWESGDKYWYKAGLLHREDGPAVEYANGGKHWCFNGKPLTREAWLEMIPEDLKVKALFCEHFIRR